MKLTQCAALGRGRSLDTLDSFKNKWNRCVVPVNLLSCFNWNVCLFVFFGPAWRVYSEDPPPGVRWRRDPGHGRHAERSSRRQRQGEEQEHFVLTHIWTWSQCEVFICLFWVFFFKFHSFYLCSFQHSFDRLPHRISYDANEKYEAEKITVENMSCLESYWEFIFFPLLQWVKIDNIQEVQNVSQLSRCANEQPWRSIHRSWVQTTTLCQQQLKMWNSPWLGLTVGEQLHPCTCALLGLQARQNFPFRKK